MVLIDSTNCAAKIRILGGNTYNVLNNHKIKYNFSINETFLISYATASKRVYTLVKFDPNFSYQRGDELNVYISEIKGAEVIMSWEKINTLFDKCLNYFAEKYSSGEDITAADTKYDTVFRCYLKVLAFINRKLVELRARPKTLMLSFHFPITTLVVENSKRK